MRGACIGSALLLAATLSLGACQRRQAPIVSAAGPATAVPSATASPAPSAGPAVIPLKLPSGKVLQAEVMVRDVDRQMGLMFRPSLSLDRGLLFVFDELGPHGIWMKNCRFPIDILWLDEGARVVHLEESVPPCKAEPCPVYQPMRQSAYVVEINAGQARREKAMIGSVLEFTLPNAP